MATLEVEISRKNPKYFVNQGLLKVIDNRTLDSISGKRKSLAYRNILTELKSEAALTEKDTAYECRSTVSNSSPEELATVPGPGVGWDEDLRRFILANAAQADLDSTIVSWLREWDLICQPPAYIRDSIESDLDTVFLKEVSDRSGTAKVNRNRTNRVKDKVLVTVEHNCVNRLKTQSRRCKRSSNRVNKTRLRK